MDTLLTSEFSPHLAFVCIKNNLIDLLLSPNSPLPFKLTKDWANFLYLHNKPIYYIGGLLSGLSLFVEEKRRRGELAMYVLPKGLESAWIMARGKGLVFRTGQYGEALVSYSVSPMFYFLGFNI